MNKSPPFLDQISLLSKYRYESIITVPATSSLAAGLVVPMPTLPEDKILKNILAPEFQLPGDVLYLISTVIMINIS